MEPAKFLVVLSMVVGILCIASNTQVMAQQCEGDIQGLIRECAQYVQKAGPRTPPSLGCCNVLKNVNIPCACNHVTKDVEQIISMEKVVFVLKGCGRPMHVGARCGSYVVRPAA